MNKVLEDLKEEKGKGNQYFDLKKDYASDFKSKTAYVPPGIVNGRIDTMHSGNFKSGEIDVESLWSVQPEIKN